MGPGSWTRRATPGGGSASGRPPVATSPPPRSATRGGPICTGDDRMLSNRLELTVNGPEPLTARFESFPTFHNGSDNLTFRIAWLRPPFGGEFPLRDRRRRVRSAARPERRPTARPPAPRAAARSGHLQPGGAGAPRRQAGKPSPPGRTCRLDVPRTRERCRPVANQTGGNDNPFWPHRDGQFWPHPRDVISWSVHLPSGRWWPAGDRSR